jgi:oligopeptide/dipeptide ABC transporter ATP-binding protein
MYASRLVELADVKSLFAEPLHPYTHGLFRSLPHLGEKKQRLDTIPGSVPSPLHLPAGCAFHPRCSLTRECALRAAAADTVNVEDADGTFLVLTRCAQERPALLEVRPGHWCACWETKGYAQGKETDPSES